MPPNEKNNAAQEYTAKQIQSLTPREHVRRRPGMYVGGTDIRALHHLIYEVVDNSIDEALAGRCDRIAITLHDDNSVTVADNGAGIPVDAHEKGKSALELVMTELMSGGKFDNDAYKVSGGLHGVGVSAVNMLSEEFVSTIYRDGYVWRQTYREGVPVTDVEQIRPMEPDEPTGTEQRFIPDFKVMEPNQFSYTTLVNRFREMAFVTGKVTITLRDERVKPIPREITYYFDGGIASFVKYLNRNRRAIHDVIYSQREVEFEDKEGKPYSVDVEVAYQYSDAATTTELAFTNTINTPDGGTHITGMRSAITGVLNRYARKSGFIKEKDTNFSGNDTLEGMTAVVSVKHPDPQFESQTKVKLLNPEVQGAVSQVVSEALQEFLEVNPRDARRIIDKCMTSKRAREAARKARDLVRGGPSLLESSTLPGKLADCSQHGENAEIYIVEGDSAGGCFSGDTKVALADGRNLGFEELVKEQAEGKEHFVYTIRKDGRIGLEQAIHARVTKRNAKVVRLTLDNGETITCTPDHRFMLRDGTYKQAQYLTQYDALMPNETTTITQEALAMAGANMVLSVAVAPVIVSAVDNLICVINIESIEETVDVYDLEVPITHNFALASGVFVHNSAKQGRDRHFQAILPLRGKILNTERARLDKILDNNEIKSLISALGTGIHDDFDVSRIRYDRVIIMSVAGDEPTLVKNRQQQIEFVRIGDFIDDCLEGRRVADAYQVMSFDLDKHETRFRPLKAVIRHPHKEAMYRIRTRYNRSVKVTSSHSVFVYEDGDVKLKKGNEIKIGDWLVASHKIPRPSESPETIDLLELFTANQVSENLYVQGESVRKIAAQRALDNMSRPELWAEPRVEANIEQWQRLINHRKAQGLAQQDVAKAIGVKQAITISQWERGIYRPILPQFLGYLETVGWEDELDYSILPSKIDNCLEQDDESANSRWRVVSNYKSLFDMTESEIAELDDDIMLAPQAYANKAFPRYLPVTPELCWFLGWYVAEGTMSQHQISLNIGTKDVVFMDELKAVIEVITGEIPRCYQKPDTGSIKLYFHNVMLARLIRAWGLDKPAHKKVVPDLIFSLAEELQLTFLEGYFLGDGTIGKGNISFTTNSPALKDGLLYLFGQNGLVASNYEMEPQSNDLIETRHPYFNIVIGNKIQLTDCRKIWQRHPNAHKLDTHIANPASKSSPWKRISEDLLALEVISAEEVELVGDYVYDFSVEKDENFICGTGGLCAHNTDADVDGSHIRTLLLTFFFRHMQPLIQEGHLYIAQPPIYLLKQGRDSRYIYPMAGKNDAQVLDIALRNFKNPERVGVQRYKGLGEMNPEQLWETTMNPETRTLLQVTIEDAAEADRVFDMLMGASVPPRKRFIQTNAKLVKNLDI